MKTILIVDDDLELCKGYAEFLKSDYNILCAPDGQEALKVFESEKIDLVILDLIMPVMNGLEILRKMKELQGNNKFIILTALMSQSIEFSLREAGADAFLTKPVKGRQLLCEIGSLLADS